MPIIVNKGSLDGSMKPVDSDVDSLGLYGDGEAGKFNEEGSFIGQVTHAAALSVNFSDVSLMRPCVFRISTKRRNRPSVDPSVSVQLSCSQIVCHTDILQL